MSSRRENPPSSLPSVASTSSEGNEGGSSSNSTRNLRVTLLSTEWRSTKGGVSTFNRELSIQLAKHPNVEVSVFLLCCSEEDKVAAKKHNVHLIKATEMGGYPQIEWLSFLPKKHLFDCVIGHGALLGHQVEGIRHHHHCTWIQVVHTAPEELVMYKCYENAISRGEEKHQSEVKLCEMADLVVAVGPKLTNAFTGYLRNCGKDHDIVNLTPGIFSEFADVKQATKETEKFSVLVLGRGDGDDFRQRGYDIAARAIFELKDESQKYKLMFVGAPSGEEEEVKKMLLKQGIDCSHLTVRCFTKRKEQLPKLFCEVDLMIMPPRTEGFGLTALEALSAGLPVLVSGNSGLGEALKKVPYGSNWVVESEDPKVWANAIKAVCAKNRGLRLGESNILREEYANIYSWKKQCDELVEKMKERITPDLPLKIDAEVTPEQNVSHAVQDTLNLVATKYLKNVGPSTQEEFNGFLRYLIEVRKVLIVDTHCGSSKITVECGSLQILEDLWKDYCSGHLNEMAQKYLVTEEIMKTLGLVRVKLTLTIPKEKYTECKNWIVKKEKRTQAYHHVNRWDNPPWRQGLGLTPAGMMLVGAYVAAATLPASLAAAAGAAALGTTAVAVLSAGLGASGVGAGDFAAGGTVAAAGAGADAGGTAAGAGAAGLTIGGTNATGWRIGEKLWNLFGRIAETLTGSQNTLKLAICGSGDGAQVFAGIASSRIDTDVRVLSLHDDEVERWNTALQTTEQIQVSFRCYGRKCGKCSCIESKPGLVTKTPQEAMQDIEMVVFMTEASSHQVYLEALTSHIKPGTVIVGLPADAKFELQVLQVFGSACTIITFQSPPWTCRATEFGVKCEVFLTENTLLGAIKKGNVPPKKDPVATLQYLLGPPPELKVSDRTDHD